MTIDSVQYTATNSWVVPRAHGLHAQIPGPVTGQIAACIGADTPLLRKISPGIPYAKHCFAAPVASSPHEFADDQRCAAVFYADVATKRAAAVGQQHRQNIFSPCAARGSAVYTAAAAQLGGPCSHKSAAPGSETGPMGPLAGCIWRRKWRSSRHIELEMAHWSPTPGRKCAGLSSKEYFKGAFGALLGFRKAFQGQDRPRPATKTANSSL